MVRTLRGAGSWRLRRPADATGSDALQPYMAGQVSLALALSAYDE